MASIKDLKRMCKSFDYCEECVLKRKCGSPASIDEAVEEIVEKWVEEHPDDCRAEKIGENIMTELKPCPFCGEKPDDYIKTMSGISQAIVMYITCRKCGIEKSTAIQTGVLFERLIEAHEKLIKDWNARKGE